MSKKPLKSNDFKGFLLSPPSNIEDKFSTFYANFGRFWIPLDTKVV
jgi:hypothetical protein